MLLMGEPERTISSSALQSKSLISSILVLKRFKLVILAFLNIGTWLICVPARSSFRKGMFSQNLMSSIKKNQWSSRISNGCSDKDPKSEDFAFVAFNLRSLNEFNSENGNLVLSGRMRDVIFS